jgi:hypothetical protein
VTFGSARPALAVTGHGNGVCRPCVATTSGVGFRVCPSACVPSSPSLAPAMDVETKGRSVGRSIDTIRRSTCEEGNYTRLGQFQGQSEEAASSARSDNDR